MQFPRTYATSERTISVVGASTHCFQAPWPRYDLLAELSWRRRSRHRTQLSTISESGLPRTIFLQGSGHAVDEPQAVFHFSLRCVLAVGLAMKRAAALEKRECREVDLLGRARTKILFARISLATCCAKIDMFMFLFWVCFFLFLLHVFFWQVSRPTVLL